MAVDYGIIDIIPFLLAFNDLDINALSVSYENFKQNSYLLNQYNFKKRFLNYILIKII